MVGHSVDLPTHVAMNMADSIWPMIAKAGLFGILTMNYGLFIEVCQNSVTAV